jgi:hypothetical protein
MPAAHARAPRHFPWYLVAIGALGAAIRAPLIGAGFVSDDYVLLAAIERRSPLANTPWNLWSFYDGVPSRQAELLFNGALPWWTEPTAAHAFFRPLSSGVLLATHWFVGPHPAGYYALLVTLYVWNAAMAAVLFNRLVPRPAAAIALALFCTHALAVSPTTWVSALHVPLATALGLTGWWWHLRWRDDGWTPGRFASIGAFVAGLLAGETGLGLVAYVICREVGAAGSRRRGRATALVPVTVVAIGYVALYRAFHRGAHAIDGYVDPGENALRFVVIFAKRLVDQLPRLVTAPADGLLAAFGRHADAATGPVLGSSAVVLATVAFAFDRAALRACAPWAAGAVLCALPALLGPTDRALYPATLGSAAVLGTLVASAWQLVMSRSGAGASVRVAAAAAGSIVVLAHVGGGAIATFEGARSMTAVSVQQLRTVSGLGLAEPKTTDVAVVLAEDQSSGPWGGLLYEFATGARARSWQALSLTPGPHSVGRVADDTIEIAPAGGGAFQMHLYRDAEDHPMHPGDRVPTRGLTVEVVATDGGRPTRIRVHGDRSLDDATFCFASRGPDRLFRIRLPPVGMGMWLP